MPCGIVVGRSIPSELQGARLIDVPLQVYEEVIRDVNPTSPSGPTLERPQACLRTATELRAIMMQSDPIQGMRPVPFGDFHGAPLLPCDDRWPGRWTLRQRRRRG